MCFVITVALNNSSWSQNPEKRSCFMAIVTVQSLSPQDAALLNSSTYNVASSALQEEEIGLLPTSNQLPDRPSKRGSDIELEIEPEAEAVHGTAYLKPNNRSTHHKKGRTKDSPLVEERAWINQFFPQCFHRYCSGGL